MKVLFFTLCVLICVSSSAYAQELYNCIDSDGNEIITNMPQDGMKCTSKGKSLDQNTPKQLQKPKQNSTDSDIIGFWKEEDSSSGIEMDFSNSYIGGIVVVRERSYPIPRAYFGQWSFLKNGKLKITFKELGPEGTLTGRIYAGGDELEVVDKEGKRRVLKRQIVERPPEPTPPPAPKPSPR